MLLCMDVAILYLSALGRFGLEEEHFKYVTSEAAPVALLSRLHDVLLGRGDRREIWL